MRIQEASSANNLDESILSGWRREGSTPRSMSAIRINVEEASNGDRDDGGGDDNNNGGGCSQPAFLAYPKAVLGRAQREGQRKWKLGSSLASELPLERVNVVSRIHRQHTQRRVGNVAAHGCESGEPRGHTSAHGDGAEADGHRLGGQQHSLHGGERPRQTGHRLQEVLVRAKSAHRTRVHHELSVHGRSARRDPLHGNEGSRQVQLGRGQERGGAGGNGDDT